MNNNNNNNGDKPLSWDSSTYERAIKEAIAYRILLQGYPDNTGKLCYQFTDAFHKRVNLLVAAAHDSMEWANMVTLAIMEYVGEPLAPDQLERLFVLVSCLVELQLYSMGISLKAKLAKGDLIKRGDSGSNNNNNNDNKRELNN